MRLENIEYILEIARLGSISAASKKLWIGTTSLSALLRSVESELGAKIFVRTPKGLTLTDEGKELLPQLEQIWKEYQKLLEMAEDPTDNKTLCTVGCYPALAPMLGSYIAEKIHETVPYRLTVKSIISRQIIPAVSEGLVDFGIATLPYYDMDEIRMQAEERNLVFENLGVDELHLCIGSRSPLAEHSSVTLDEIREVPISAASFSPQFTNTYPFIDYSAFPCHFVFDDLEGLKLVIGNTNTAAFLPSLVLQNDIYIQNDIIRNIRLTGGDFRLINFIVYPKNEHLPKISQSVLETVRQFYRENLNLQN